MAKKPLSMEQQVDVVHQRRLKDRAGGGEARLQKQRDALRNRVELLDPKAVDPDLVSELVRRELNVAHPDEVIVPLK